MLIFFDLDGTCAEWRPSSSHDDLVEPGYYAALEPQENVIEAARILQERGHDVGVMSGYLTDAPTACRNKMGWCGRHMPFIPKENIFLVPACTDADGHAHTGKASYLMRIRQAEDPVLVDDHTPNLLAWEGAGGIPIKCVAAWNGTGGKWKGPRIDSDAPAEAIADAIEAAFAERTGG